MPQRAPTGWPSPERCSPTRPDVVVPASPAGVHRVIHRTRLRPQMPSRGRRAAGPGGRLGRVAEHSGDGQQRVRAKDALGAYGERVAAAHLVAAGMTVLDRNWRCPHRRDRHRGARRRRAGGLRGQDPVVDGVRAPARGGHGAQGRPAAAAGGRVDRRAAGAPGRTCGSTWSACCGRPRGAGRGRARAGGGLSAAGAHPGGRAGRASTGTWSRSRPTSATGCPVVQPGRAAGRGADRVARPGAGGDDQQRAALAGHQRVTVNLSPASLPKRGSSFDLAHRRGDAGGARRSCRRRAFDDAVLLGELGLDGRVRPVRGVLPAVLAAARAGRRARWWSRRRTRPRRRWCPGVRVTGVRTLRRAGRPGCAASRPTSSWPRTPPPRPTRPADDAGASAGPGRRARARRRRGTLLEVAAAGGHHLLMSGRPERARRCWPSGCPACCRRWTARPRSR